MLSPCLFQQNTRRHAHTHICTHLHTCSDPRKPFLSCYPRVCSSKTRVGTHSTHACTHMHTCSDPQGPFFHVISVPVPAKHTQAHTHTCTLSTHMHAHKCTHMHSQAEPLCSCFPLPPPLSASQQAPGRGTTALPGDSHTIPSPSPPCLTQHRGKSSVSSLKCECLLPE